MLLSDLCLFSAWADDEDDENLDELDEPYTKIDMQNDIAKMAERVSGKC